MVFANGLGVRSSFTPIVPLIHRYENEGWTFITWDYRGLFENSQPKRLRRLAIPEHAEDLAEILRAEGIEQVDLLCGFSMGVQVSLETAALYPELIERLVLLNGTHGQVFNSGAFAVGYVWNRCD